MRRRDALWGASLKSDRITSRLRRYRWGQKVFLKPLIFCFYFFDFLSYKKIEGNNKFAMVDLLTKNRVDHANDLYEKWSKKFKQGLRLQS
ncbi:MAG TPA: hypothetical protein VGA99_14665, partial [bacterium]